MDDTTRRVGRAGKTDPALPDEADRRALEIRAEIAETRNGMSETIDALQARLSPAHLAEQAKESVRNAATEKVKQMADTAGNAMDHVLGTSLADSVRANPIPAAMIGVGAAWLLMRRNSAGNDRSRGSWDTNVYGDGKDGEYGRGEASGGYGAVGTRGTFGPDGVDSIGDKTRELADRAQDAAANVTDATRRTARRAQVQMQDVLRNNPLALGAAAMLIGAVVGLSVPETEVENNLMGEARDSVVDRARDLAGTAADRVSDAASELAGSAHAGTSAT